MVHYPLTNGKRLTLYRYLTGPDDRNFCHRVTEALSQGWALYGSPSLTYDSSKNQMIAGQAVTKEVDGVEYRPEMELSEQ